ncbi:phosphatidate cytidylyltransferase [Salinarimonas rosea]|uniref:phosphatidate cytidylyltransferase n=1 Tax=Salinarimonas rosea TaxID=552063 RepID=UPI00040B8A70|nr:phosphatidate cytidylyltransferase [Salinarimonas rosea]
MPAPGPRGDGRGFLRSETGIRFLSALVLVALALGSAWIGGPILAAFWLLAAGAAVIEWRQVGKLERPLPMRLALLGGTLALSIVAVIAPSGTIVLLVAALAVAAVAAAGRTPRDRLWGLVGLAVTGTLATAPVIVREHPALGLTGLLWIFAVVWGTDIAAYFTGRALGGPKLAPRISPGKTWSGFVGGLVVGTLAGALVVAVGEALGWERPLGWPAIVVLSAVASVIGQVGDLAESKLKRHFNVKDSSKLIPGHGGVLDRIDAFVAVCAFVLLGLVLAALVG